MMEGTKEELREDIGVQRVTRWMERGQRERLGTRVDARCLLLRWLPCQRGDDVTEERPCVRMFDLTQIDVGYQVQLMWRLEQKEHREQQTDLSGRHGVILFYTQGPSFRPSRMYFAYNTRVLRLMKSPSTSYICGPIHIHIHSPIPV